MQGRNKKPSRHNDLKYVWFCSKTRQDRISLMSLGVVGEYVKMYLNTFREFSEFVLILFSYSEMILCTTKKSKFAVFFMYFPRILCICLYTFLVFSIDAEILSVYFPNKQKELRMRRKFCSLSTIHGAFKGQYRGSSTGLGRTN